MKKLLILLLISLCAQTSISAVTECDPKRSLEEYFCITPDMAPNSLIDSFEFTNIPQSIISLFNKELSSKKYTLLLDARWESPYFGAGVSFYKEIMSIVIFGGMTRMEGMTPNAYALVVCHELGHILGGAPYSTIKGNEWASIEGQSDFFAASVCLPRYFRSIGVEEKLINNMIEESAYQFFKTVKNVSSQTKNDTLRRWHKNKEIASTTLMFYPNVQCRYENYRDNSTRPKCWFKKQ